MIRYWMGGGGTTWNPIPDMPEEVEKAIRKGALYTTVLSLTEEVLDDDDVTDDERQYMGPLYFDIDNEGDIETSISAAKDLVSRLKGVGVPDRYMELFATGSKGFHIQVPMKSFTREMPTPSLPSMYLKIAIAFPVEGLDLRVYSRGKGRVWRLPNVKRENGNFKVPITHAELKTMTEEIYQEIIKEPRDSQYDPGKIELIKGLSEKYKEAKKWVAKDQADQRNRRGVSVEELEVFGDGLPKCIEDLTCYTNLRKGGHFNNYVNQFLTYMVGTGKPFEELEPHFHEFAKNSTSHRHSSEGKRFKEAVKLFNYQSNKGTMSFNCGILRSTLDVNPCQGCPLEFNHLEDASIEADVDLGIVGTSDGYFCGDQQISTFLLQPTNIYRVENIADSMAGTPLEKDALDSEDDDNLEQGSAGGSRITGIEANVMVNNKLYDRIRLPDDCFTGRSSLISSMAGMGPCIYLGTDAQVQKLKHQLYTSLEEDVGEIKEVFTAGITIAKPGSERLVYTEPGFSIDQYQVRGTHEICSDISNPPTLASESIPAKDDMKELAEVMRLLINVNTREAVGLILGWYCMCHLKTHLITGKSGKKEFPLLSLWGNAGSGKTRTAELFCYLHGIDHIRGDGPVTVSSITEFAYLEYVSSSTTIPKILDEYNKSKMSNRFSYDHMGELLKGAWGNQVIKRGGLSTGPGARRGRISAKSTSIPLCSPLVICSEQQPTMPALQQRTVCIHMKKSGRQGKEKNFHRLMNQTTMLKRVAKAMVYRALITTREQAWKYVDDNFAHVPTTFDTRPRFSYATCLGGIDFFSETLLSLGADLREELDELKSSTIDILGEAAEQLSRETSITEVDLVLDSMGEMAAGTLGDTFWLTAGEDYIRKGDNLYLDLMTCMPAYIRYAKHQGIKPVIDSKVQMKKLVEQEEYCQSVTAKVEGFDEFAQSRKCVLIHVPLLELKGLDTTPFINFDEVK